MTTPADPQYLRAITFVFSPTIPASGSKFEAIAPCFSCHDLRSATVGESNTPHSKVPIELTWLKALTRSGSLSRSCSAVIGPVPYEPSSVSPNLSDDQLSM